MTEEPEEPSGDEIEAAYQKALLAFEDVGWEAPLSEAPVADVDAPADSLASPIGVEVTAAPERPTDPQTASAPGVDATPPTEGPRLASGTDRHARIAEEHPNVTAEQVIEAALFVGGGPLSSKKICALLRGSFDTAFVERAIEDLNALYVGEGRPYEIRLADGGYRLELRPEYEKLRQRVYGTAPREVRLTQDVLEVLSLVAYRQPITREAIESHGKQNAGNLLRQLLRRDLVAIERGSGGPKDVHYRTTNRFLSVFGLSSLQELPQPEDFTRK